MVMGFSFYGNEEEDKRNRKNALNMMVINKLDKNLRFKILYISFKNENKLNQTGFKTSYNKWGFIKLYLKNNTLKILRLNKLGGNKQINKW